MLQSLSVCILTFQLLTFDVPMFQSLSVSVCIPMMQLVASVGELELQLSESVDVLTLQLVDMPVFQSSR